MDSTEVQKLYRQMVALFRVKADEIDPLEIDGWYELFADFNAATMGEALSNYAKNYVTPPKPAHLIKEYRQIRQSQQEAAINQQIIKYIHGEKVYTCPYCRDSGLVLVDDSLGKRP